MISLQTHISANDIVRAVEMCGIAGNQKLMDVRGDRLFVFYYSWHMAMNSFLRLQTVKFPPKCYVIPTILESSDFEFTLRRHGDIRSQGDGTLSQTLCVVTDLLFWFVPVYHSDIMTPGTTENLSTLAYFLALTYLDTG